MATATIYGAPMPPQNVPYVPKSRKRTKYGRYSHEITYEELSSYFHLPTEKACQRLGVGLTILKRICRRFGLPRWPYKKPTKNSQAARRIDVPTGFTATGHQDSQQVRDSIYRHVAHQPSPFANDPTPLSWNQHQLMNWTVPQPPREGCSRPIPRRVGAPAPGEPSVMEATLRALGISTESLPSDADQGTDGLGMLISAINQSESEEAVAGSKIPGSPSVNTLDTGSNQEPDNTTIAAAAAAPAPVITTTAEQHRSSNLTEPCSTQQPGTPVTALVDTALSFAPEASIMLSEALNQLASNGDGDSKSAAVVTLVDVLASNPGLAQQLAQLVGPATATHPVPPVTPEDSGSPRGLAAPASFQKLPAPPAHTNGAVRHELLRLHDAQLNADRMLFLQELQNQGGPLSYTTTGMTAEDTMSTALRSAELSVKLQALQAKMAARHAALQRLQARMALRNMLNQATGSSAEHHAPTMQMQMLAAKLNQRLA